jgi:CRP-like cAMP-binding protein
MSFETRLLISKDSLERIVETSSRVSAASGELFYQEGGRVQPDTLYYVRSGIVGITKVNPYNRNRDPILSLKKPGGIFGLENLDVPSGYRRFRFSAEALVQSDVIPFPSQILSLGERGKLLEQQIREASDIHFITQLTDNDDTKVAYALQRVAINNTLQISQSTIGRIAGVRRDIVNELLGQFVTDGLIRFEKKRQRGAPPISILMPEQIRRISMKPFIRG